MTTANKITIFRILLVPFFIVQLLYYIRSGDELNWLLALVSFAVAALADGLDGHIARRYNQKSELGAILDPLADKSLLISAILLLTFHNSNYLARIPLWLTGVIVGRDMIVSIGVMLVHHMCGKVVVRPSLAGKVATVFQMGTVLWILFRWTDRALPLWIWGAAIFAGFSGVFYIFEGIRQLSASPGSAAAKSQ